MSTPPDSGSVTVCSAGHLPTLISTPGDGVRRLPSPVNTPLGVGDMLYQQSSPAIPPEATLVLYTDGLVETPSGDIEDEIDKLATVLDDAFTRTNRLDDAADHVLAALLPDAEGHDDDVTLLLAQLPAAPLAIATVELPATASAVSIGRSFVVKTLCDWGCVPAADDARLLVSEILTNAVQHAEGPLVLHLRRTDTDLAVEVSDLSPHLPQPRLAAKDEESGRGLILVDAIADTWGVRPDERGKTTWFTLRL